VPLKFAEENGGYDALLLADIKTSWRELPETISQTMYGFLTDANTRAAVPFALRMGILLALSSLFVLISTPKVKDPDGMSVLVTVLFVCWFPTLDSGSILEKIVQRLIGTFVGAALGIGCGFTSLLFCPRDTAETNMPQIIFLATCMLVVCFVTIFLAGRVQVGKRKVIQRFNYATILCILTFCICMLPFASSQRPKWKRAMDRVVNVIIGCILGAVGSFVIWPRPTVAVLYEKTARQVQLAGEASQAVMQNAANIFSGRCEVNRLADEIFQLPAHHQMKWELQRYKSDASTASLSPSPSVRSTLSTTTGTTNTQDVALEKYEEAIAEWNTCKLLVPLARYGPFGMKQCYKGNNHHKHNHEEDFQLEMARTLARSLRIQTSVVVLDGMVRNEAQYDFEAQHVLLFRETGRLIESMLTLPLDQDRSKAAAKQLFRKVELLRTSIDELRAAAPSKIREQGLRDYEANLTASRECRGGGLARVQSTRMEDDMGMGLPKYATGGDENTLLFLQLVEHLILRSLRLYQAWDHVEAYADALEDDIPTMRWSNLRR